jgi:hypothetical protein
MLYSWQNSNYRKQNIQKVYHHGPEDTLISAPPPYTDQEQINMQADRLAETAHKALPHDFTARYDSLHFPEQHISLCLQGQKVTSKITRNVAHSFNRPKLEEHLKVREEWSQNTWDNIAWKSFTVAFNKTPTARQPTITKLIFSFWCTNM